MKKIRFFWGTIALITALSAYSVYKEYSLKKDKREGKAIEWRLQELEEKYNNQKEIEFEYPTFEQPKVYAYPNK